MGQRLCWPLAFIWSHRSGLNRRPAVYKTAALPLSYGGLITYGVRGDANQGIPTRSSWSTSLLLHVPERCTGHGANNDAKGQLQGAVCYREDDRPAIIPSAAPTPMYLRSCSVNPTSPRASCENYACLYGATGRN